MWLDAVHGQSKRPFVLSNRILSCWQIKVMRSKVESEIHSFSQDVEKFSARWHQLKPQDDLLDGDRKACAGAFASLKERRAELDELLTTAAKLRWVNLRG